MSVNWVGSGTFPVPVGSSRIGWRGAGTIPMWEAYGANNIGDGTIPVWVGSGSMSRTGWSGSGRLTVPTNTGVLLCGNVFSGAGFFPKFIGAGQSLGCSGSGAGNIPSWRGAATALAEYLLSGSGIIPAPSGSGHLLALILTGAGNVPVFYGRGYLRGVPISTIYNTLVLNASHKAVSEYINFPFNSLCVFNDKSLGANSTGIFELSGNTDNGVDIYAEIESAIFDMANKGYLTKAQYAYMTYRSDGEIVLVLGLGEDDTWESLPFPVEDKLHEGRVKIAKGIKERFISFGIKNKSGSDFDIDKLRILVQSLTDRIK